MRTQLIVCYLVASVCLSSISFISRAQTENDADMMAQGFLCTGPMYSYSSWDHYWEGTRYRDNRNLGTVSTRMAALMGNYGISKKFNVLFSVPYVKTHASAGTMAGMKGLQDLSLFLKWMGTRVNIGKSKISVAGVLGYSTPLSNYTPDFLPLSIGLGSTSFSGRIIGDYVYKKAFLTASAAYIRRDNITIDRTSYYTTEMHNTNHVRMPDAFSYNVRAGYRSKTLIAEAILNNWTTLGGFDITRNNMPFPSNRMIMTSVGPSFKYRPGKVKNFTFHGGADFTLSGRNVGKSKTYYGGVYYIFNINHHKASAQAQPVILSNSSK